MLQTPCQFGSASFEYARILTILCGKRGGAMFKFFFGIAIVLLSFLATDGGDGRKRKSFNVGGLRTIEKMYLRHEKKLVSEQNIQELVAHIAAVVSKP